MKISGLSKSSSSRFNRRKEASRKGIAALQERAQKNIKPASVKYLTRGSFILAVSSDSVQYAFPISKFKGYAGQELSEFGLKEGSHVKIEVEEGIVTAAEIVE